MYFQSENDRDHILVKLSLTALYLILGYNALMLALGYIILQQNPVASGNTLVRNIIFMVAIADMAAIFLVKRSMLAKAFKESPAAPNEKKLLQYKSLFNITIIISIMCLSISTYGLILVILGEKFEILMLFVALSLISYQFFRLRSRDFPEQHGPDEERS